MDERDPHAETAGEPAVDELVEQAAEGLWLRLRDVILVSRKLEGFVF